MKNLFSVIRAYLIARAGLASPLSFSQRLIVHLFSVLILLVLLVCLPFDRLQYRRATCTAQDVEDRTRDEWQPRNPWPPQDGRVVN